MFIIGSRQIDNLFFVDISIPQQWLLLLFGREPLHQVRIITNKVTTMNKKTIRNKILMVHAAARAIMKYKYQDPNLIDCVHSLNGKHAEIFAITVPLCR